MNPVTTESIMNTSPIPSSIKEYYNRTVVFDFGPKVKPIAVQLDFLYLESDQFPVYPVENYDAGVDRRGAQPIYHVYYTYEGSVLPKNKGHNKYKFLNVIRELAFKYGIQHEYYKNKYGKWIDLGTIRPHFNTKRYEDNIFSQLFVGTINEEILESSIYAKVCDNTVFDCTNKENYFVDLCQVKDINNIPAATYFVKDPADNGAYMYQVGRADNSYKYENCKVTTFTDTEFDSKDTVHPSTTPRFSYQLADADTKTVAVGDFENNNNQMFNDLLLSFMNPDGTPYTDLNDLFIILNGVVVGYTLAQNPNQIYIKDVVKYAERQPKTLIGVDPDHYRTVTPGPNGESIVSYDIPREGIGYVYGFDIQIYRWENVSISDIIQPISTGKLFKTVERESNKSFFLVNKLNFSTRVDKDTTILLCGNTIVDKQSWDVNPDGSIQLTSIEEEFDMIYSEIYPRIQEYLASTISHELAEAPKIEDFVRDNNDTEEEIDKAYQLYTEAYARWKEETNSDEHHYAPHSAFDVTVEQFRNRQYGILVFSNTEEKDYEVKIIENYGDIKLNQPYRDRFINENWTLDDIVIMNGMSHRFINVAENIFMAPDTWYRHNVQGIFEGACAYKLQAIKHLRKHDAFYKLNYTELVAGPQPGLTYYTFNPEFETYLGNSTLTEFEHVFEAVPEYIRALGFNTNQIYFTKVGNTYERVPSTTQTFQDGVEYYICTFNKDYYLEK